MQEKAPTLNRINPEHQQNTETITVARKERMKRKAALLAMKTATFTGLAAAVVSGGLALNEHRETKADEAFHAQQEAIAAEEAAEQEAFEEIVTGYHDPSLVVGEITIPEGGSIEPETIKLLAKENAPSLDGDNYNDFLRSAQVWGTVEKGDTFAIVKTDTDNDPNDSGEYIVVRPQQVAPPLEEGEGLPTPETH